MSIDPLCATCPDRLCTYKKGLSCSCTGSVNRTIGIAGTTDREYTRVSLGFAIDDTGSMSGVIDSVKATIRNVVLSTATIFDKYVLATFNDPYTYNLIESNNTDNIAEFVNKVTAHDGDDCQEMALTGLRDVAARVTEGSAIFVFTDASAKDFHMEADVRQLLLAKDIRVNVIVVGNLCGGFGGELYRLANATNGSVYYTPSQYDVQYVMNYIAKYAKYGVRFIRGMPASLDDLKVLVNMNCTCMTHVERDFVCVAAPKSSTTAPTSAATTAASTAATSTTTRKSNSSTRQRSRQLVWYLTGAFCSSLLLLLILFACLYFANLRRSNDKQPQLHELTVTTTTTTTATATANSNSYSNSKH